MARVFIIVLDSFGVGEAPDAASFGDTGADTARTVLSSPLCRVPNLMSAGLGNIPGVHSLKSAVRPRYAVCRMREMSAGKDTTIGHWEIAGLVSKEPLPTFPHGFPASFLESFGKAVGRGMLCNKPYSGTEVIKDYGEEHLSTGDLIVYTSADSVFQIAAHESIVPPEQLYEICRTARQMLKGDLGVGRVIARPFAGDAGHFYRTERRRDFSILPPGKTLTDYVKDAGMDVISVGKIYDIFAGRGITKAILTHGNAEGMQQTLEVAEQTFNGLCFVNLVDFDMLYGHRRDTDGYARALSEFDTFLPELEKKLHDDDLLIITADHGCDPGFLKTTDHTREYVPMLVYGRNVRSGVYGTRETFADAAATAAAHLGIRMPGPGRCLEALEKQNGKEAGERP